MFTGVPAVCWSFPLATWSSNLCPFGYWSCCWLLVLLLSAGPFYWSFLLALQSGLAAVTCSYKQFFLLSTGACLLLPTSQTFKLFCCLTSDKLNKQIQNKKTPQRLHSDHFCVSHTHRKCTENKKPLKGTTYRFCCLCRRACLNVSTHFLKESFSPHQSMLKGIF